MSKQYDTQMHTYIHTYIPMYIQNTNTKMPNDAHNEKAQPTAIQLT